MGFGKIAEKRTNIGSGNGVEIFVAIEKADPVVIVAIKGNRFPIGVETAGGKFGTRGLVPMRLDLKEALGSLNDFPRSVFGMVIEDQECIEAAGEVVGDPPSDVVRLILDEKGGGDAWHKFSSPALSDSKAAMKV
ncbi:hypothetical protein A0U89_01910 [Kozakia baliensis]|uniref:Uncharacterized protein n=1 Tax=Kozakia baliensis TaxID=153496 RepID=A0A1D8UR31_9PROT|nr:hypothetical protein A0U89_01910 [Kozakia baliensis]